MNSNFKWIAAALLCLVSFMIPACARRTDSGSHAAARERALIVKLDKSDRVLEVISLKKEDLVENRVFEDGPAFKFILLGDLVHPSVPYMEASGKSVEITVQKGMVTSVTGWSGGVATPTISEDDLWRQVEAVLAKQAK